MIFQPAYIHYPETDERMRGIGRSLAYKNYGIAWLLF